MIYDIDERGQQSLYEFIYNCIKNDIINGRFTSGEKLPSKRQFAKDHGISVITVENAYAQLLTEGYIYALEKRGYFVSDIGKNYILNENISEPNQAIIPSSSNDQEDWLVDFKSNYAMYDKFPFNTWSKVMRQTLLDNEQNFLKSPDHNGVYELRAAIAKHLENFRGLRISPENIVIGAGTEYLYSLIVQLFGHSRMIAVEDPGHTKISRIYESNGVKCLHIKVDEHGMDEDALMKTNAIAAHISPSHHFPTGRIMPASRRHNLINWARENNRYIIEDDYDSEFRFSGRPIPTMASIDPNRVIYLNTFSKTLVPSIRVAYMVLPNQLMERFREKFGFYSSTVSSFEQYTLANFISGGYYERHINRMRNYYREYRNTIISTIKKSPICDKVTIEEDKSGLHFILKINADIDDEIFAERLREMRINISSVSSYCHNNYKEFEHRFIINYSAVKQEELALALENMNQLLV